MNPVDLVSDGVERIQLALNECKFTLEQLQAVEEIFQRGLNSTRQIIAKAENAEVVEDDRLNTSEYREAPSGRGPHASEWLDKPHRLVYDLCKEVDKLREVIRRRDERDRKRYAQGMADLKRTRPN